MSTADEVLKLRSDVERASADVTRLEALMAAGQEEVDRLRSQLEELGFSPDGDLEEQLRARAGEVQAELEVIQRDLASLRGEAAVGERAGQ
jgi:hypothetical protein